MENAGIRTADAAGPEHQEGTPLASQFCITLGGFLTATDRSRGRMVTDQSSALTARSPSPVEGVDAQSGVFSGGT